MGPFSTQKGLARAPVLGARASPAGWIGVCVISCCVRWLFVVDFEVACQNYIESTVID